MKKVCFMLITSLFIITAISVPVSAASPSRIEEDLNGIVVSETVEILPNGLIMIDTVREYQSLSVKGEMSAAAAAYTKSGSKTRTITNGSGAILFVFAVHGTFSVNPGVSATCTAVSSSYTIGSGSDWKYDYASLGKAGNRAYGSGYFYRKILFITVETYTASAELSCNANGTLY